MNTFMRDLRLAFRSFLWSPGFSLTAILSLSIGIGANTSIFSVANALLLRPLPYKDAPRLLILWNRSPGLGIMQDWFSTAQYLDVGSGSFHRQIVFVRRRSSGPPCNGGPDVWDVDAPLRK